MKESNKEIYLYQMKILGFLYEQHGQKILKSIEEFEQNKMKQIWNKLASEHGNSLQKLIELLWKGMGDDFKYEIVYKGNNEVQIYCFYCPFVELSISNGLKEIGFSKFCMSDYGIVEGFNANIIFTRTKTLMMGDDCCNHHYKIIEYI